MNKKNLYNTLEIPGSFLVPGFCIYVLEIIRTSGKALPVTSISSSSMNTQSPGKNRKVVEFSERSEASIETTGKQKKWFYIGMTGDAHYPSARAGFHRISGHLELNRRSTQNQLQIALKENQIIKEDKDWDKLNIKMHHYPIGGFKRITDKLLIKETVTQLKTTQAYKEYQKMRQEILSLENALIFELKAKLLNKTKGVAPRTSQIPYPEIYKSIIELVNNR